MSLVSSWSSVACAELTFWSAVFAAALPEAALASVAFALASVVASLARFALSLVSCAFACVSAVCAWARS